MEEKKKTEQGALAIEAVLGITIFLIALLSVMFISLIVRIQANIQYALGQTAKEISGYYYLLDKVGIAALTTGSDPSKVKDLDKTISDVVDLAGDAEEIGEDIANIEFDDINPAEIAQYADKYDEKYLKELQKKANSIGSQVEDLAKDPQKQITGLLSVFAKTMVNGAMSYYVAPYVCRAIMPRYMGGSKEKADKMLEAAGVTGGISAVDFSRSQLLSDKRSIKLVAIYKLDVSKITFGIVKSEMIIRQAASTAAWVRPDGNNTKKLKDLKPPEVKKPDAKNEEKKETDSGSGE